MRLLSIGYALPHPEIDNYNALTAPSYFDYDALFVDPASITRVAGQLLVEGEALEAFDGRPVINGPTTGSSVSAADQLLRRREETNRALERGAVVMVMARPNARQSGILGFEGCDRYSWLPAPEGMAWGTPFLRPAEGSTIKIVDDEHPCASILREYRRQFSYRAVFDDRQPGFGQNARVFAEAGAGLPAGVTFTVNGGLVVFIPALADETGSFRSDAAQSIVEITRKLLRRVSEAEPPSWVSALSLPGLAAAETDVADARLRANKAADDLLAATSRREDIAGYFRGLWDDGLGFREAVRRSLVLLGFEDRSDDGGPLVIAAEGEECLLEIESARGEVAEWPYVRLQRRLEERLLRRGQKLKGIVVVSGNRLVRPEERQQQFSDPLRIACENYRYTLLCADTLLALVQRALDGCEAGLLERFRRRILRNAGLLTTASALGEGPDEADKGSLF